MVAKRAEGPKRELGGGVWVLGFRGGHERPTTNYALWLAIRRCRAGEDAIFDSFGILSQDRDAPNSQVLDRAIATGEIGPRIASAEPQLITGSYPLLDRVLPKFQGLHRSGRIKRAFIALRRHDVSASLPEKPIPGEVLVVARTGFKQTTELVFLSEFLRDLD